MVQSTPSWIGRTIGGRYKIESLLGRGGMSSVYKATDPNLQRAVAVKIIHPHLTDNPEFVKRFEQEAAAVAQLRHSNIIQVHDFNHVDGVYYMVLEYVPGETLEKKLTALNKAGLRMPLADTIRILSTICNAVDYAHQRRMIHRDLKPANVIIDLLGAPILMDFGIAKILGTDRIHTATGAAIGTAAYMSPEQVKGGRADHRADIYSLGVILYEMVSGEPPFQGDSTYDVMMQHVHRPVPDIHMVNTNAPHSLIAIIEKALAKFPSERYQTAAEMATALRTVGMQMEGPANTLATRHMDHLGALWREATVLLDAGDYTACIDKLEELKRLDADYQQEKVDNLRHEALNYLYEHILNLLREEKFDESLAVLNTLRKRSANSQEIEQLEALILEGIHTRDLRIKLDVLYEQAIEHLNEREYQRALDKWKTIKQHEEIGYVDSLQVEQRATEGICLQLYNQAVTALAHKQPQKTLAIWQQIKEIDAGYPDSQQIVARAEAQRQRRLKVRTWSTRLGLGFLALLAWFGVYFFILRGNSGEPTTTAMPVSLANPATSTLTPSPTITATPTADPTATPSATTPATPTVLATETSSSLPAAPDRATALRSSSIFIAPDTNSEELTFIRVDAKVTVLGRSAVGNWLYVRDDNGIEGFIFAPRLAWEGDFKSLPVREPAPTPPPTNILQQYPPLELDLWTLPGSVKCDGNTWSQTVYIRARGGNGTYNYYWNNEQKTESVTNEGIGFIVQSPGGPLTGTGKAASGDGQEISQTLFIPVPDCS